MASHAPDLIPHQGSGDTAPGGVYDPFQAMLRVSHDCLFELDGDYGIQRIVNPPLGFGDGPLQGTCLLDLLQSTKERQEIHQILKRAWETAEPIAFDLVLAVPDGGVFRFAANAMAEKTPSCDRQLRILVSCRDMTPRLLLEERNRDLEEKVQRLERLEVIERMAGGIAHDFNSMLHPIIAFASMGLRKTESQVDLQSYFNSITIAAQRARDVAQKILVFISSSKQDMIPVRLSDIVEEVLRLQRAGLPANIRIEQLVDRDCGSVSGEPTQLHQMIMNLVTNAVHAMNKNGGTLRVTLEKSDRLRGDSPAHVGAVCLAVSDTGTGMSPEELKKVFTPFYSTKPRHQGTGLGLSIVEKTVKSHDGRIEVDSTPGRGSEFRVILPVFSRNGSEVVSEGVLDGSEHLLLVDPEQNGVNRQANRLKALGYHVTTCRNGEEAWKMFQASPTAFDLVLTDLRLPGMSGYRLAMKVLDIRPDLLIILSLTHSEPVNVQQARAIGIREVLLKPFTEKQLTTMLRAVLDAR